MKKPAFIFLILSLCLQHTLPQDSTLFIPRDILSAYDKGSRSYDGKPGEKYFQNRVDYVIDARFDPVSRKLDGHEEITFYNNSPNDLNAIGLRFYQNIFVRGGIRGRSVDPADLTDGVELKSVDIDGQNLDLSNEANIPYESQTNKFLRMKAEAGSVHKLTVTWSQILPGKKEERMGGIDESSFFVAYWFPQVAVYDDISGWDTFDYNNVAEMYNEFGDFDVTITVPENFVIWATGELQNPEEVLDPGCLDKYRDAYSGSKIVQIISRKNIRKQNVTMKGDNAWHFKALNVSDFAFGISDHYLWDASTLTLKNGNKVFVQSAYLPSSVNYRPVAMMTRYVIDQLSDSIIGKAFPYPSMTVFNGNDGMEFPMIVNDEEENNEGATWFLTAHEVTHTYLPFLVGINQRRYGWMDEGMTTMLGYEIHRKKTSMYNMELYYLLTYPQIAGTQEDVPQTVNSSYLTDVIFQQHEYMRPGMALWILQDILGEEMFRQCLLEFINRWSGKHPTPYDLFFTFNDVSGENLNWFWEPWLLKFDYPDLAIEGMEDVSSEYRIIIANKGGMPFPSSLEIKFGDGTTRNIPMDARIWADGNRHIVSISKNKKISGLVLHTEGYPDCVSRNNFYPAGNK